MPSPRLPADPSAIGPGEREIEEFPYRHRAERAEALTDWEAFAGPWHQRARERGFANALAMIAHDEAQRGQPDETGRQAAAMREAFANAVTAEPQARDGGADRAENAPVADGGEPADPRPASEPTTPRPWDRPYTASQRAAAADLLRALMDGELRGRSEAEARIESIFPQHKATAERLKNALAPAFDASGQPRDRQLGPASFDSLRDVVLRIQRNELDDEQEELDRKAFASFEARTPFRIDPTDTPDIVVLRGSGRHPGNSVAIALPRPFATALAMAGSAADAATDALMRLAGGSLGHGDAIALLTPFLPTVETSPVPAEWDTQARIDGVRTDPRALAQLMREVESLSADRDPAEIAAAIAPLVLHKAIEPSWARIGLELLVMLSPLGTAIDLNEAGGELLQAARDNDPVGALIATGDLAVAMIGLVPGGRLVALAGRLRKNSRRIYRIENEEARALLASTKDPRDVRRILDEQFQKDFREGSGPKVANWKRFRDTLPEEIRQRYSAETIDKLEYIMSYKVIPAAAEREFTNIAGDLLAASNFKVLVQQSIRRRSNTRLMTPDNMIVPRDMSEKKLNDFVGGVMDSPHVHNVLFLDAKSGMGGLSSAQRKAKGELTEKVGSHAFGEFHIPHHKLSDDALVFAIESYMRKHAGGLPKGVTRRDLELIATAIRGQVPKDASAIDVIGLGVLTVLALGGSAIVRSTEPDDEL